MTNEIWEILKWIQSGILFFLIGANAGMSILLVLKARHSDELELLRQLERIRDRRKKESDD